MTTSTIFLNFISSKETSPVAINKAISKIDANETTVPPAAAKPYF